MVGLSDIPCVGVFVERVSEYTVAAVFRGLKYMFCYKALVHQLNSETEKLEIEKGNMSRKVKEEKANGKEILGHVLDWQNDVERIHGSVEELSPSCSCIQRLPIPNPVSRFRLGRNVANKTKTVAELIDSGKNYLTGEIAHLPPVKNLPIVDTAFEEFQSRKDTYEKLWDALVNEDSPLVHGIYGMAGVGKTRMMEKFWEDAMKKNIFRKVVRVDVGCANLDKIKLQNQIAGYLDCKLESQDVERRASQLENSLRNWGKVLLILDDVWTEIRLHDIIGTPFGDGSSSKGSNILLTSRDKEVCLLNKCQHLVEVKTLSRDEALYLFKNTIGPATINSLQDESLVQNVCDECGHLPLVIHAVGKALKGKPRNSWKDAHNQLKKGEFKKIVGVDPQVYKCIKLSIDNLKDDDAKSCLFLCSLFPEDANISMELLIRLATGSQLIPDGELRILSMVHHLKVSSLLLGYGQDITKVHDVIRDVARSIASTDSRYVFLHVTCKSGYFPSDANYCTGKFLRLDVETDDVHFKEHLVCPDLHTLWLQSENHPQQFSGGFFTMFMNLSFLMLQNVNISLEQFSLRPLGNLGTLTLLNCDISKTDASLFPTNLETLCICYCQLPRPMDVANLKYLRKLEIHQRKLVMVPNFISSLSSLEELHIPKGFSIDHEEYHMEARVIEIGNLTHLTSLHFQFYNESTFQDTNIFSNLDRYNISVGRPEGFHSRQREFIMSKRFDIFEAYLEGQPTRWIELYGNQSKSWEGLIARAEEVILGNSNVEVSSICNRHTRAFEDLKILDISQCDNMGHLASISLDEIQYSLRATGFSKLTILKISKCSKLKYLFCNSIARSLGQLQELNVDHCYFMEAVIMSEGTSDREIINFSKLKSLRMSNMRRLASFYAEKKNMHSCSTSSTDPSAQYYEPLFDGMVAFPSLENLDITGLLHTSVIWGKDCSFFQLNHLLVSSCKKLEIVIPQAMLHRLNNLEYIVVKKCSSLRSMFPPSVASDLMRLKEMRVSNCVEMKTIIDEAGEQLIITDGMLFPELTFLRLAKLPSLVSFWCHQSGEANMVAYSLGRLSSVFLTDLPSLKSLLHGANFEFHMPALKEVEVDSCGISTLFTFSMFRKFQLLEKLKVNNCQLLEKFVEELRSDKTCDRIITLSQLTTVALGSLPNLKSFLYNEEYEFHMPVIKKVMVLDCGLSNIFNRSVIRNLKQLEKLKVSDCKLLEGIFEDVRGAETSDMSDRIITLSGLSSLHLKYLPNLKSCFYGENYECNMPALTKVKVVSCGLSALFTCSVFQELPQLQRLVVMKCGLLESIVENVKGDETSDMNGKIITIYQLSIINLQHLPNLKSFSCTASYVFNMPKLFKFWLRECPQIEYFTPLETRTSLVEVFSEWHAGNKFPDLNDYITQIYKTEWEQELERAEDEKPRETETGEL